MVVDMTGNVEFVPGENSYSQSVGLNLSLLLLQFFLFFIKVKLVSTFFNS